MCGFLKTDEITKSFRKSSDQNLTFGDSESSFDIYEQEFFLHTYSLILKEKKQFVDSKEGYTYVNQFTEQIVSARLLNFVPAADAEKWQVITNIKMKKILNDPMDEFSTAYIDLDLLISLYMQQFILVRK